MSSVLQVPLPGPIVLVPAPRMLERFAEQRRRHPDLPDPTRLAIELAELTAGLGVPARLRPGQAGRDPGLAVFGERFAAVLYPTSRRDAYFIGQLGPLRFQDHDQLVKAALLLRPTGWPMYPALNDVSRQANLQRIRFSAYWEEIGSAWQRLSSLTQEGSVPQGVPAHHLAALDLWGEVIEATRAIELAKQRAERPLQYRRVTSAREERHSTRGVYVFELAYPAQLGAGAPVALGSDSELPGRIIRVDGRMVTVRFDQAVHRADIPPQGALVRLPSDRVFRAQAEAVYRIRSGEAANPRLLRVLVDHRFTSYHLDTAAVPNLPLDKEQREAFSKALTVPDLALILGPPGAGKTWTISEVTRALASRGRQVLVASHTNRAVDNVLEALPAELRSVRVGNETAMTTFAKHKMVEAQVGALRDSILAATETTAVRFTAFLNAASAHDRWLALLDGALEQASAALAEADRWAGARTAVARQVAGPAAAEVDRLQAAFSRAAARSAGHAQAVATRAGRLQRAAGTSPFGRLRRRLATRSLQRAERALAAGRQQQADAERELAAAVARLEDLLRRVPEAERARIARVEQLARYEAGWGDLVRSGTAICQTMAPFGWPVPPLPAEFGGWREFRSWAANTLEVMRTRATLLGDWRRHMDRPGDELHHELVRYADVVAATCVGTATTSLLKDLTFDVAIVDEAGQIALPNLLIPLTRARRAMLVGDHHQLPPYVDDDITRSGGLLSTVDDPGLRDQVRGILTMSTFEALFDRTPASHRNVLVRQRRMPKEVADFVSAAFYRGALETATPQRPAADPLFGKPFVIVDTADRSLAERAEQRRRATEAWAQAGYLNPLEARLITRLVLRLAASYQDWGVIVPYRAQAAHLISLLTGDLDEDTVADNVGTVDSFQGGERELIIYGCTRSNPDGGVGFLAELRRLNVAISRVKRQLIVVGDTATLTKARDPAFAALAREMVAYVRRVGEVRASRQVESALDASRVTR